MSRRTRLLLLLALLLLAIVLLRQGSHGPEAEAPAEPGSSARPVEPPPRQAGRLAARPDPSWIAAATKVMRGGVEESDCGPYRLITDAGSARFERLCEGAVSQVEAAYAARLGVEPVGPARGAILIFSERQSFRAFVAEQTGLPRGYAAFSRASRGIIAAVDTDSLDTLAATLTHEIAHLVHRRAFGPDLPPWLSEGLADAVGDTATAAAIGALERTAGAEAAAARLGDAIEAGEQRQLRQLLSLSRRQFDREVRSFDYEQSALLVRFLLTDDELDGRFRRFLGRLAAGAPYRAADVAASLEIPIENLEDRFETWLRATRDDF